MSESVTTTAFRDCPVERLNQAIRSVCAQHSLTVEDLGSIDVSAGLDLETALLHAPKSGWTVIVWPEYFTRHHFPMVERLSAELQITASAVQVPDGSHWTHRLYVSGECVDQFSSYPDLWARSKKKAAALREAWRGDASTCAEYLKIPVETIVPYFVYWPGDSRLEGKAFPEDRSERSDSWAFVDFWHRFGADFPPLEEAKQGIRLPGYDEFLPAADS